MLKSFYSSFHFLLVFLLTVYPGLPDLRAQNTNPVKLENMLPGADPSEWDIVGAGDLSIQGFATDISYNKNEVVKFKIKTPSSNYEVRIYRLGWYGGKGAREVGSASISATLPQTQLPCHTDAVTGMVDCGNWQESAYWNIPSNAVSGLYIAKLNRLDQPGKSSHIAFVVRDDESHSDLFVQTSDATWQAYNIYGDTESNGKSLYTGVSGGKASKVSYNRPFYTRAGGGGGDAMEDWLFNSEYPMIRFLEKNGYDISYTTDIDTDRRGNLIRNHKVFLSVGHDEYWSKGMRDNVTAARDAGINLAFFGGNEVYWKTRWENDNDGVSYRTLVCYKEGMLGENQCDGKCDPTQEWTGLWRSGCDYPGGNGCKPENALSGQISWDGTEGTIQVPSEFKNLRFWRNTSIANLSDGTSTSLTEKTLGYEWNPDQEAYRSSYPAGRIILSRTELAGKIHHLSMYKHSSGALVFGAGTVQWSWGLDDMHDRGDHPAVSLAMQQATVNLFADMNVKPTALQTGLVLTEKSNDAYAPSVTISSPIENQTLSTGMPANISGIASDVNTVNGEVAGIEISTDQGGTWRRASGTSNWTFSWTPSAAGAMTILVRAFDDSGNISSNSTVHVTVNPQICPCNVFSSAEIPTQNLVDEKTPLQLGMKFRSDIDGFVTGARFYKQAGNEGVHTAQLYNTSGQVLAQAQFVNETASGWQQVLFSQAVAVSANTTYIISYHSPNNTYSAVNQFFSTAKISGHLKGLAEGEDGSNGVYAYSPTPAFPTQSYESSNYFVDVVFDTQISSSDVTGPYITGTVPANNAQTINITSNIIINFNEAIEAVTVNSSTIRLLNGTTTIPVTLVYNSNNYTVTLDPNESLSYATNYSIQVAGGSSDPVVKDVAGNSLAANYSAIFRTQSAPVPQGPSPNDGPGGPILVISATANPFSRYAVEILRAEGLNEFDAKDISQVSTAPASLNPYDVIILGEVSLSVPFVSSLTNWVNQGGTLVAFKPGPELASLLGITSASGNLKDKYIKINTAGQPGTGITDESMQFHGTADLYTLTDATSIALLYSDANMPTVNPAITTRNVGTSGGKAIAFTYDLARSIVYTRQGNPEWAGQKRDGQINPIRSDDQFFPDWVDFNKIAIPQADEQQRLLVNIILQSNLHKKPLPRFWYLPRGLKAAVIMTGDDHANNGTAGRFDDYITKSGASNDQSAVDNWTAIRGTSYIFPNTPISNAQISAYQSQGFEIALHLNTNCSDYTYTTLSDFFNTQLATLSSQFPGINTPVTNRTHCITWSDWASTPKVEFANGIRLDANYYYWPDVWVNNRPGMFTGSGMPMRFADLDGSLIDVYQAATQLTDESGINYGTHINTLLDNALNSKGYYGVFTANMHTDDNGGNSKNGSDIIVASALQKQVPVISAKQMLTWLDGRNNSSFGSVSFSANTLNFNITAASGSNNLRAMLPVHSSSGQLSQITANAVPVSYSTETIKGILYAFFPAANGSYTATYTTDNTGPQISNVNVTQTDNGNATISWTTDEPADSKINYGASAGQLNSQNSNGSLTTNHSITITGLNPATTYYFSISSQDAAANNSTLNTQSGNALSFTTPAFPAAPCFTDAGFNDFNQGTTVGNKTYITADGVILKPERVEEFSTLPASDQWLNYNWQNDGSSTISSGSLLVNGARYSTTLDATYSPGTSIEFVASFGAVANQHIGFGAGNNNEMFNNVEIWAMFSTGSNGSALLARVNNNGTVNDYAIPGSFLGAAHRYKIVWETDNFKFYIDGVLIQTTAAIINTPMRVGISDYQSSAPSLNLDWIRISPYLSEGLFTSRIYDAGAVKSWQKAEWVTDPLSQGVTLFQRQGNSPDPSDGTWTAFSQVQTSGDIVGGNSRYIQYQADLKTSNTSYTPLLKSVSIGCSDPVQYTLIVNINGNGTVTKQPEQSTYISGSSVTLTAVPQTGFIFSGWSSDASGTNNPLQITVTGNLSVTANFQQSTTCNAGTSQVLLNTTNITNVCPASTINLNSAASGTAPTGSTLVFFTSNDHADGTLVTNQAAAVPGTYYAFYYDASNGCYNTNASVSIITATQVQCPDLRPYMIMDNVEFNSTATSNPFTVRIRNTRDGSIAAAPITIQIYKPTLASTISLTGQAANDFVQVAVTGSYYEYTSNVDIPYSATGGYFLTGNLTIPVSLSKGAYNFRAFLTNGSGGEPTSSNTNNNIIIGVLKQ